MKKCCPTSDGAAHALILCIHVRGTLSGKEDCGE